MIRMPAADNAFTQEGAMIQGLDRELHAIREKVAAMSVGVGDMYLDALRALSTHDSALADNVVARDRKIDLLELELDELCLNALARYAPKAAELRYVVAILRLIVDLERIGDHSKVIARQVFNSHCAPLLPLLPDFEDIARRPYQMLNEAIETFFEKNDKKYKAILESDEEVGRLQKNLNQSLVMLIHRDSANTDDAIALINVIRRMERVADHAKNIAELAPYISSGAVIRHKDVITHADTDH